MKSWLPVVGLLQPGFWGGWCMWENLSQERHKVNLHWKYSFAFQHLDLSTADKAGVGINSHVRCTSTLQLHSPMQGIGTLGIVPKYRKRKHSTIFLVTLSSLQVDGILTHIYATSGQCWYSQGGLRAQWSQTGASLWSLGESSKWRLTLKTHNPYLITLFCFECFFDCS